MSLLTTVSYTHATRKQAVQRRFQPRSRTWGTGNAIASSASIGTIGGGNHGFNWGGFSNGNFLQDSTGVYYLGSTTNTFSSTWEVHRVDSSLNSTASQSFSLSSVGISGASPGYGFMMGGNLFFGQSYNSDMIVGMLDFATGQTTTISIELDGSWTSSYWNNTFYDPNADTLYFNNRSNAKLYKLESAAAAFGVSTPVPEPATLTLFGLGLLGLGAARRRKKLAA